MPRELSPAEERAFARYEALGTPEELQKLASENATLKTENADRRKKNKDLEDELAKAKPPEGAVVLTGDDAEKWAKYQTLGEPAELEKLSGKVTELETKDAERTRKDAFAAAVKALKWPEETVTTLLDMKSLDGATVEVKTEKVTGKDGKQEDAEVPYVTLAGEGQKTQKFADFATESPQLKGIRTQAGDAPDTTSRPFPEQYGSGNGKAAVTGGVDTMLENNRKAAVAPNPLRPAKP